MWFVSIYPLLRVEYEVDSLQGRVPLTDYYCVKKTVCVALKVKAFRVIYSTLFSYLIMLPKNFVFRNFAFQKFRFSKIRFQELFVSLRYYDFSGE